MGRREGVEGERERTEVCANGQRCALSASPSAKKPKQERQPVVAKTGPQERLALKPICGGRVVTPRLPFAATPRHAPYKCSVSASNVLKCLWQRSHAGSWLLCPALARCPSRLAPFRARKHSGHAGPVSGPTHVEAPSGAEATAIGAKRAREGGRVVAVSVAVSV